MLRRTVGLVIAQGKRVAYVIGIQLVFRNFCRKAIKAFLSAHHILNRNEPHLAGLPAQKLITSLIFTEVIASCLLFPSHLFPKII